MIRRYFSCFEQPLRDSATCRQSWPGRTRRRARPDPHAGRILSALVLAAAVSGPVLARDQVSAAGGGNLLALALVLIAGGLALWQWRRTLALADKLARIEAARVQEAEAAAQVRWAAADEDDNRRRLWSTVFGSLTEGVIIIGADDVIRQVNPAFCRLTRYRESEVVGQPSSILESPPYSRDFYRQIRSTLEDVGRWHGELRQGRKDGSLFVARVDYRQVRDEAGELTCTVAIFTDITQRDDTVEVDIGYLANYDALTGLPNRFLFEERMARALVNARHIGKPVALLCGDLDRLQQLEGPQRDALGKLMLKEASQRLLLSVRRDDLVARLEDDRFTVLLPEVTGEASARQIAERIAGAFLPPLRFEDRQVDLPFRFGITLFPRDGDDVRTLLEHAEAAKREARTGGGKSYRFYVRELGVPAPLPDLEDLAGAGAETLH